jgi:hypothetical protein
VSVWDGRELVTAAYAGAPSILWNPSDHGLITWAYDPVEGVATSTPLPTAGKIQTTLLKFPVAQQVTNICLFLVTAGATLTAGQCFAALYQGGNLLGVTADQSGNWAGAGGFLSMPIAGGPVVPVPGIVEVAYWFNGTTGPAFLRANSLSAVDLNQSPPLLRYGSANTGVTMAPAQLGARSLSATSYWAGLS